MVKAILRDRLVPVNSLKLPVVWAYQRCCCAFGLCALALLPLVLQLRLNLATSNLLGFTPARMFLLPIIQTSGEANQAVSSEPKRMTKSSNHEWH